MSESKNKKVTIYEVAKKANCSIATVSLTLKGDARVKESTKQRVRGIIKELGYRPNYLGSALAKSRTNSIGVIVPDLVNPVFAEILSGIEEYLVERKYTVLIGNINLNLKKERFYLNALREQKVDGLIILPTFIDEIKDILIELDEGKFPFVITGNQFDDLNVNTVSSNLVEGAFIAVEHLINKGHKNIAFVSAEVTPQQSKERYEGYKKALSLYGIPYNKDYIIRCSQDLGQIKDTIKKYFVNATEVTALFCLYDYIAIAACKALGELGLRVPDDVAIMGYDNIPIADYLPTSLTTVDPNNKKIGELSGRLIINMIDNKRYDVQHITLSPKLVKRHTT